MEPIEVIENLWNMSSGMQTDWPRIILLESLMKFKPETYNTDEYKEILRVLRKLYK